MSTRANIVDMAAPRYRRRTQLRGVLPAFMAARIPKGAHDCGEHEFYLAAGDLWRCYHCEPGLSVRDPYDEKERLEQERELARVYARIEEASDDPALRAAAKDSLERQQKGLGRLAR